jgi:hypothetical protein
MFYIIAQYWTNFVISQKTCKHNKIIFKSRIISKLLQSLNFVYKSINISVVTGAFFDFFGHAILFPASCKDVKKELSVGSVKLFSLWAHLILYTAELTVLHEAPESNKWVIYHATWIDWAGNAQKPCLLIKLSHLLKLKKDDFGVFSLFDFYQKWRHLGH